MYKDLLFGFFVCGGWFLFGGGFMVEGKHPHIKILIIPAYTLLHLLRDNKKKP